MNKPSTKIILVVFVLVALAAGAYLLAPRFERNAPAIKLPETNAIGLAPVSIELADQGAGLKSVSVTLLAGGKEHSLLSEQYGQAVPAKTFSIALPKDAGLKEGPAVLRVKARDGSWWQFFSGNEIVAEKNLNIDITPPTVELIADDRYINFGGVGVIVYKSSADTAASGVKIGQRFFPGYQGQIKDHPDYYIALFAHAYDESADARAAVVATDNAGNSRELPLVYELKNVKYRKSTIALSDEFLQNKVAVLLRDVAARQGSAQDVFVAVNKGLRKENEDRILAITTKSTPSVLWKGAFSQLSNSKVEANFADERTYTYNGAPISTAFHLGYDLSVTKNYPVEAANSGKVVFAGDLGIYGNTVILDHGLGLFTLYGHLSSIAVNVGDTVSPRQPLGKTGETGLAAGDHLHYGVYLHGVAVLPVEWWDAKWIDDNVVPKLEGRSGEEIAQSQQKKKAPVKTTKRKKRR